MHQAECETEHPQSCHETKSFLAFEGPKEAANFPIFSILQIPQNCFSNGRDILFYFHLQMGLDILYIVHSIQSLHCRSTVIPESLYIR